MRNGFKERKKRMRGTEATPLGIVPGRWREAPHSPNSGKEDPEIAGRGPGRGLCWSLIPRAPSRRGYSRLGTFGGDSASFWLSGVGLHRSGKGGLCKHFQKRNCSEQALQLRLGKLNLTVLGGLDWELQGGAHLHGNQKQPQTCSGSAS